MKIKLNANPDNAPCCVLIELVGLNRDKLFQTDYEFPFVAGLFGWRVGFVGNGRCPHKSTDGTIPCADCGLSASMFIQSARNWIDEKDGQEVEVDGEIAEILL